jgi:hypothetical protein
MRWLLCTLAASAAATVGGIAFMLAGEIPYALLVEYAPGYFAGAYPVLPEDKLFTIEDSRKFGWGDLVGAYGVTGALTFGATTLFITGLRLGGIMSLLRSYLIVCLSGIVGACVGAGIGYLLGIAAPGYYRGVLSAGAEAWFDPVHVGIGLGVTQGLPAGLVIGSIVVVVTAWSRSRGERTVGVPQPASPSA